MESVFYNRVPSRNVICTFKTSLRSRGRPHGDQGFIRFCSSPYKHSNNRRKPKRSNTVIKYQVTSSPTMGFIRIKRGLPPSWSWPCASILHRYRCAWILTSWPSRSRLWGDQIQNDCSPFLAETDNLLSNTLPAAKDHQRPMRSSWGVWHWKSAQSIINANWCTWYQFCDSVGPLASLSFWILSFRLTELHLFISDVFAMNLL